MDDLLASAFSDWWQEDGLHYLESFGKLLLAGACGAVIGRERESRDKPAGLRTHILLALGACVFALLALAMNDEHSGTDVLRLVQGVLMGTGFICGGVIFQQGTTVRGLTTAAGLWIVAAIGMGVGVGHYFVAIVATVLAFIIMEATRLDRVASRTHEAEAQLTADGEEDKPDTGSPEAAEDGADAADDESDTRGGA
jgi:putative Mg2+ transporter-C (MgtC) family protein